MGTAIKSKLKMTKGQKIRKKLPPEEITADLLIIGMSIAFLWEFTYIWLYSRVCFYQPHIPIRIFETAIFLAILVIGIRRFVRHLKRL